MRVLVTRPQRDAEATAARLVARGHQAVLAPVMEIAATGAAPSTHQHEGLIATSAHAPELLAEASFAQMRALRLYVVGTRTAAVARARGFSDVTAPARDANALAARVLARAAPRSHFLYLAGRDRKAGLETALVEANHHVEILVVYEARALPALPAEALTALRDGGIDAVLHYSRRSAELFLALATEAGLAPALNRLAHVCISAEAAEPAAARGLSPRVAATPDAAGLFRALESL